MEFKYIPLLSGKSLHEMFAEEFKNYIKSMYGKPEKRKTAPRKKKVTSKEESNQLEIEEA